MALDLIEEEFRVNRRRYLAKARSRGWGHVAEDVVQETFTLAITYHRGYNHALPLGAWLNTILNNVIRKFYDEEQGRFEDSYEEHSDLEDIEAPTPLTEEAHRQLLEQVFKIKDLEERAVCNYYFRLGFNVRDIVHLTSFNRRSVTYIVKKFKDNMLIRYKRV
jgi:DNA-directed RNA polymerase specialized sigma24 family protein